jgi:hypothetical protein
MGMNEVVCLKYRLHMTAKIACPEAVREWHLEDSLSYPQLEFWSPNFSNKYPKMMQLRELVR